MVRVLTKASLIGVATLLLVVVAANTPGGGGNDRGASYAKGRGEEPPPPQQPKKSPEQQASQSAVTSSPNPPKPVQAGRILFYMPLVSKSMKITFMPLAEELASRGHKVTVVMPHDAKEKPNLDIIKLNSKFDEITTEASKAMMKDDGLSAPPPIPELIAEALNTNDAAFGDPRLRKYISDPKAKFDVVLVSPFIASEAGYYLAHHFDANLVIYFTGQASASFMDWALGQPHNPAYVPFLMFDYEAPMSFTERVINTVATMVVQTIRDWYLIGQGEALLDKHFPGQARPSLLDIERNASLALHYGHPLVMDGMKPLSPHFQYIGMMNCRPGQPLPKDLAAFMDGASEHGVVYVSFGSVIQAKEMSDSLRLTLLKVFGELKQRVIWKWETEEMLDKPDNVKLSKWLPQQDILAHPNTKVFITHAGQSSTQETLCHQKPVVAIPVFGDQPANGKMAERVGFGKSVPLQELTEDKLRAALKAVLEDPSYTNKAQEHGRLLTDQINRPLDRAVWWLEYLIRHPEAKNKGLPVHNLTWYQYFLLDVILFLASIVGLFAYVLVKICGCICGRGGKKPVVDSHKKKKN